MQGDCTNEAGERGISGKFDDGFPDSESLFDKSFTGDLQGLLCSDVVSDDLSVLLSDGLMAGVPSGGTFLGEGVL